jgi:hypothetical protein
VDETKETFTTAVVRVGLKRDNDNVLFCAVEPSAKYQCAAVVDAQGATLYPRGPDTTWDAPTPPPVKTTVDASDPPDTAVPGDTAIWMWAGTTTDVAWGAAPTGVVVTDPVTGRGEELVRIKVDWALPPVPVAPGQNQAADSAFPGATPMPEADRTPGTSDPDDTG